MGIASGVRPLSGQLNLKRKNRVFQKKKKKRKKKKLQQQEQKQQQQPPPLKNNMLSFDNLSHPSEWYYFYCLMEEFLLSPNILHPHQRSAVEFLEKVSSNGCILADEMGLGKTLTTLAFASLIKARSKHFRCLIVAPLSVAPNWMAEIHRFTRFSATLLLGNAEQREQIHDAFSRSKDDLLVTTYEFAKEEWLQELDWTLLVVDEAHKLKNRDSVLYKSLFVLSSGFNLLLTGTPVQNNLNELFSLLHFACPKEFSEVESFLRLSKEQLHELLRRFMIRRLLSDVDIQLPLRIDISLVCPMSNMQRNVYLAALKRNWAFLKKGSSVGSSSVGSLSSVMMNLRKATAHPYLFDGMEPQKPDGTFEIGDHLVNASGKLRVLDVSTKENEKASI